MNFGRISFSAQKMCLTRFTASAEHASKLPTVLLVARKEQKGERRVLATLVHKARSASKVKFSALGRMFFDF